MDEHELDGHAFRQWLEQARGREVGLARCSDVCPLALWLRELHGGQWYEMTSQWYGPFDGVSYQWKRPVPLWAQRFVDAIDRLGEGWSYKIMGEQALSILDEVLAQAGCCEEVL